MDYAIVENGIIVNVIVAENDETAAALGAVPLPEGARIGDQYILPTPHPDEITQIRIAIAELAERQEALDLENKLALAELAEILLGGEA